MTAFSTTGPYSIVCPLCRAQEGEPCNLGAGVKGTHADRRDAARQAETYARLAQPVPVGLARLESSMTKAETLKHEIDQQPPASPRYPRCSCGAPAKRDEKHDAYFCTASLVWLELSCVYIECEFCVGRPKTAGDGK